MPSHCSATSATRPARAAFSAGRMLYPCSSGSSSRSACAATTCPISRTWNPVPSASSDSMSSLRWLASPASCWYCWRLTAALAIAARGGLASLHPRRPGPARCHPGPPAQPRRRRPSSPRARPLRCGARCLARSGQPCAAATPRRSRRSGPCPRPGRPARARPRGRRGSPAGAPRPPSGPTCRPWPHGTRVSHGGRDVNHGPFGTPVTTGTSSGAAAWRGPWPTGRRPAPRSSPRGGSAAAPAGAGSRSPRRPGGSGPGGRRATGRRCP